MTDNDRTRTGSERMAQDGDHPAPGDDPASTQAPMATAPVKAADAVRVAGIDCGTNSIRLMVADVDAQGMRVVVPRIMRVVRLGQGVDRTHMFAREALARTYAAVREFADVIDETGGVDVIRFVATSATRDAGNRQEFSDTVRTILGVRPEVIPGTTEARLSYLGATGSLSARQRAQEAPVLVVDLGGGSTELVIGGEGEDFLSTRGVSLQVGSVRVSERWLHHSPATQQERAAAVEGIDRLLEEAFDALPLERTRTLIGVSGTVTTLSLMAQGEKVYSRQKVDGARISFGDAQRACDLLGSLSTDQMADWPVIHPGRRDVIAGGALVWSRLLHLLARRTQESRGTALDVYTASERGLLDGLILDAGQRRLSGADEMPVAR